MTSIKELRALYDLGFALLLLRPKEKRPVESGWTSGSRKSWKELEAAFQPGMNIGVRTGEVSKIGENYLAVIDVDVKNPKARKTAVKALKKLLRGAICPEVRSGSGNGSRHLYCVTAEPFKMITVEKHDDWEICVYSDGRQMVLPPSIHPSGSRYLWRRGFVKARELPLLSFDDKKSNTAHPSVATTALQDFAEAWVDIRWLPISDSMRKAICDGAGVTDRSAHLLPAAVALHSVGCSKNEILTVLTDPDTFLGKCAYEHAQTKSRERAAKWLWNYTVRRVLEERDAKRAFAGVPIFEGKSLDDSRRILQDKKLEAETDWKDELIRVKAGPYTGQIQNGISNVYTILDKSCGPRLFRFNDFSKQDEVWEKTPWEKGPQIPGREFQERDVQKIKLWISHTFGFQPTDDNIWAALINIADKNAYHPIKEYLLGLPAWDETPRLDFFLEKYLRGDAPKKYMRAVSRKIIVAAVARVFQPGIKFDTMLVLEGAQGLRKSTAVMTLASKAWFTDANLNLKHKDSIADMAGKWFLEQGEMNVMRAHEVAELKQFLSRDTDRMRPSYGRKSQDYPRQSVFIGTTNEDVYLKDASGSRRFWPIRVTGDCDVEAIKHDRDQIFAEALMRYREGEPLWISDSETDHLAKRQQAEREVSDELCSVIEEWLMLMCNNSTPKAPFDPSKIKMKDLFVTPGPFSVTSSFQVKMDMQGQKRVGACLHKLGYESKSARVGDHFERFWVCDASVTPMLRVDDNQKDPWEIGL